MFDEIVRVVPIVLSVLFTLIPAVWFLSSRMTEGQIKLEASSGRLETQIKSIEKDMLSLTRGLEETKAALKVGLEQERSEKTKLWEEVARARERITALETKCSNNGNSRSPRRGSSSS